MSANSAAKALTFMKVVKPDVLISDLAMPGKNGFELLQEIRSSPKLMDVPAIAITGHGDLRAQAEHSGYQRFMKKPIDADGLCRAIGELAHGGRGARG
jgi:CheY-like chemotaxis protein